MPCVKSIIVVPRITNGTTINSTYIDEFRLLTSSNNICGFISTVKTLRRVEFFLLLTHFVPLVSFYTPENIKKSLVCWRFQGVQVGFAKATVTYIAIACNAHKMKNHVYPKSTYQVTEMGYATINCLLALQIQRVCYINMCFIGPTTLSHFYLTC